MVEVKNELLGYIAFSVFDRAEHTVRPALDGGRPQVLHRQVGHARAAVQQGAQRLQPTMVCVGWRARLRLVLEPTQHPGGSCRTASRHQGPVRRNLSGQTQPIHPQYQLHLLCESKVRSPSPTHKPSRGKLVSGKLSKTIHIALGFD